MGDDIKVFQCSSWDDFIFTLRKHDPPDLKQIFRGHADSAWKLSSIWERILLKNIPDINKIALDELTTLWNLQRIPILDFPKLAYLNTFKGISEGLPGLKTSSLSEDDWWALGRHHELITPLLDWSASPFIAAFFAFIGSLEKANPNLRKGLLLQWSNSNEKFSPIKTEEGNVAIWSLTLTNLPENEPDFKVIKPKLDFSHFSSRVREQKSFFTRLTHNNYLDLEDYFRNIGKAFQLAKYEIPAKESFRAIGDLIRMNITFSSLFPDLGGAALQSNIEYDLRMLARAIEDKKGI